MAMYSTHPLSIQQFRDKTLENSKPGLSVCVTRAMCCVCKKPKDRKGGTYKRGTSRHNPTRFTCADCRTLQEKK